MKKYGSSDITGFFNAQCPTGGHQRKITNQKDVNKGLDPIYEMDPEVGNHLVIDCEVCSKLLIGKDSWSSDPNEIPLTPAEVSASKKMEQKASEHSVMMAEAFARIAEREVAASRAS